MKESADAVVVGGGIIGAAVTYELSKRGLSVVLIERNTLASCATYASAGMLAPASDSLAREPAIDLCFESYHMWSSFKDEVEEAGGVPIDFRSGILRVAGEEEEEATLKQQAAWAGERGLHMPWLSPEEALEVEPALSPEIRGGIFSADEHNVNPPRVVEAMRRAAIELGAEFREHTPVTALARENGRVTGVMTPGGETSAGTVVLAVGAWGCEAGEWLGMDVPVHPVRGQVAYLNKLARPLRHTVLRGIHYASPRNDGTTLIGCTREHGVGYRVETTVAGMGGSSAAWRRSSPAPARPACITRGPDCAPGAPTTCPSSAPRLRPRTSSSPPATTPAASSSRPSPRASSPTSSPRAATTPARWRRGASPEAPHDADAHGAAST